MTIRTRFVWVSLLLLPACLGVAQTSSSGPFSIAAAQSAFSGSTPVHQVTMSGTVNWTAGSLEDSGPVTLQASADGSWTTTMELGSGARVESQTAAGSSMTCQFQANSNKAAQMGRPDNCRRSLTWFLPPISFQPSLKPSALTLQPLGSASAPELKTQLAFADISAAFANSTLDATASNVALDPNTLLPTSLSFNVFPDTGPAIPIPVRVEFSDYRLTSGAQVPYSIKRYLNGTLQAEITINSVSLR
jgi:hypothetical protein